MTVLAVRRAGPADVAALAALRRAWTEEDAGPVPDSTFDARFADWVVDEGDRRLTWLALDVEEPVGMLSMAVYTRMPSPGQPTRQWGYVSNVFVVPGHRDRGVGRALVDASVTEARDRSYVRLVLNPSPRSVPFYERAGFGTSGLLALHLDGSLASRVAAAT